MLKCTDDVSRLVHHLFNRLNSHVYLYYMCFITFECHDHEIISSNFDPSHTAYNLSYSVAGLAHVKKSTEVPGFAVASFNDLQQIPLEPLCQPRYHALPFF